LSPFGAGGGPGAGCRRDRRWPLALPLRAWRRYFAKGTAGLRAGLLPGGLGEHAAIRQHVQLGHRPRGCHLVHGDLDADAAADHLAAIAQWAQRAQVQAETERMRNALLSAVSHDLRTPLTAITGAASSLLDHPDALPPASRQELLQAIYEEANRLDRLVKNLLDITRLEAGAVHLHKEWHPLDEVVGAALTRVEGRLRGHPVRTQFPPHLPMVPLDGVLIQQVVINLLENALKYTPPDTPIDLSASATADAIVFEIADRGPGLPPGDEQRIFDKFYRAGPAREGGVGLGLTICRGIVEAHGGRIWAEDRPGGGAVFRFTLPLEGSQPSIEPEQAEPQTAV